jgi:hypothetical protein
MSICIFLASFSGLSIVCQVRPYISAPLLAKNKLMFVKLVSYISAPLLAKNELVFVYDKLFSNYSNVCDYGRLKHVYACAE